MDRNETNWKIIKSFDSSLGMVAESVEKLPETYFDAINKDCINELHNTMYRIQVSLSIT